MKLTVAERRADIHENLSKTVQTAAVLATTPIEITRRILDDLLIAGRKKKLRQSPVGLKLPQDRAPHDLVIPTHSLHLSRSASAQRPRINQPETQLAVGATLHYGISID